jgi:hypothetical protein
MRSENLAAGLHPATVLQAHVHQHQVGVQACGLRHGVCDARGLADDLDAFGPAN